MLKNHQSLAIVPVSRTILITWKAIIGLVLICVHGPIESLASDQNERSTISMRSASEIVKIGSVNSWERGMSLLDRLNFRVYDLDKSFRSIGAKTSPYEEYLEPKPGNSPNDGRKDGEYGALGNRFDHGEKTIAHGLLRGVTWGLIGFAVGFILACIRGVI